MSVEGPQTVRGYSPQTLLTLGRVGTNLALRQWSLHPLRFPRYRGTETLTRNVLRLSPETSQRLRFDG